MNSPRFRFYLEMAPFVDSYNPHNRRVDWDKKASVIVTAESYKAANVKAVAAMNDDWGGNTKWQVTVEHFEECELGEVKSTCDTCKGQGYYYYTLAPLHTQSKHTKCPVCQGGGDV